MTVLMKYKLYPLVICMTVHRFQYIQSSPYLLVRLSLLLMMVLFAWWEHAYMEKCL